MTQARDLADGKFDTDTLVVDAANNRVGIGTASPSANLEISNDGNAKLDIVDSGSGDPAVRLSVANSNGYVGTTTNHPLLFIANDTERGRFLSGGGLTFNGDTAAANALDDYEEGTFTPTFVQGATVTSYTAQSGRYTKIGRQVMVEVDLDINVGSATSAHIYVGPMPFTSTSSAPYGGGYFVYNGGFYNSLGQWLMFAASTSAGFYRQSDGGALGGTTSGINIGGNCRFVLFYIAA